ncbi:MULTISPECIES: hypothetical protein [Pseudomonas aeruginosa group]|uniref:hypothetical protein n=1 Tax=Pseudomonas aeruginosa group TaxID=136841 RepID=UPI0009BB5D90|nr:MULTISPECIES: hypothetical protein [Pseudomonas aeruginosa group]ARC79589.1 hypothetical protein AXW93_12265 [Pseudomonas aeruginosa]MDK2348635.1 hypothetical protein [Pseudomonas paraeruginosa]
MAIHISYEEMLRQSPMAVHDILLHTVSNIDAILGDGYAKEHPDLIAACVAAATAEFNNGSMIVAIQEASERVAGALELAGRAIQAGLERQNDL